MENTDEDILKYLIEVESEAASLALDATEEADKRRSAAKQRVEAEYHSKYSDLISSLDAWLDAEKEKCDTELKAIFSEYDERLRALSKDFDSFYSFLDSILIGK